jgi:DNA repair exonuclease SbcCD nuclease subunit
MTNFRFLHVADIHLDSPLTGLARYEGLPVDDVRAATRGAFDNMIDFACRAAVDFVIIAGDLFDGDWRDMGTGLYLARQMGRLEQAGIAVYVLQGNHDAASVVTKSLPWPGNVHRFGSRSAQTFRIEALGVALHGWSFAHQAAPDNLAVRYPQAIAGMFNIGVLHTSLSGRPGHASYAPCELADLRSRGYDYWALGHVHAFERVCEDPPVIFPGNVQGRNIRETGAKGGVLVDVEVSRIDPVHFDVLRWARVIVGCDGCDTMDDLQIRLRDALDAARREETADRGFVVRVILEGATPLAGTLADAQSQLRDDARAHAGAISPDLWIEKVQVRTSPPAAAARAELSDDVVALLASAGDDAELLAALAQELSPFLVATAAAQPPEEDDLRHAASVGDWSGVAEAAASSLLVRLGKAG